MIPRALEPTQVAALQQLVAAGRLRVVPADPHRASGFLGVADERLTELASMSSPVVRYGVAYDAAHDVGEAFLAAFGYSTANGPGQHAAIADSLAILIDEPPDHALAARGFDRARRTRNQQNYHAAVVGAAQAADAETIARHLRTAATERGIG